MNENMKDLLPEDEIAVGDEITVGDNLYTLADENGNEFQFELVATAELKGERYCALIPLDREESEEEFCEYAILKVVIEDGEETLVSIEDPDEEDDVADYFDDLFAEEIDYDASADNK